MVTEVTNNEPILVLNEKKYIISELSQEAQYCISQINDIQKDINICTITLDRHRTAYSGSLEDLNKEIATAREKGDIEALNRARLLKASHFYSDLSKEEYKKMADNLRENVRKYQKERDSKLKKISTLRSEARSKLISEIKPILAEYTKENNISVVIKKAATLGRDPKSDITNIIVEKLDKVLPSLDLK